MNAVQLCVTFFQLVWSVSQKLSSGLDVGKRQEKSAHADFSGKFCGNMKHRSWLITKMFGMSVPFLGYCLHIVTVLKIRKPIWKLASLKNWEIVLGRKSCRMSAFHHFFGRQKRSKNAVPVQEWKSLKRNCDFFWSKLYRNCSQEFIEPILPISTGSSYSSIFLLYSVFVSNKRLETKARSILVWYQTGERCRE